VRSRTYFSIAAISGDWLLEGSNCALISIDRVLTIQSFRRSAVKGEMRFPQTAPTDVAVKSVDWNKG
jgi:hypothetical protein